MTVKTKRAFIALVLTLNIFILCGCGSSKDKSKKVEKTYDEWLDFYKEFIQEHYENWERFTTDNLKYDLFYIDDDNIPEVVIGYGDNHVCGMYILSTDGNKVYNLGMHGESGRINYCPRKNLFFVSYGNQGFFRGLFLTIHNKKVEIKNAHISDGHTVGMHYYIIDKAKYSGYSLNNRGDKLEGTYTYDGDMNLFDDLWDDYESYEVDKQEFNEMFDDLSDGHKMIDILYHELRYTVETDE